MSDGQTSHTKLYVIVILCLAVLTGTTVMLSYLHLPHKVAIPLAALIAATKCTLIASVFMHLKWERRIFYVFIFTGLLLVTVLVLAIIPDIGLARP